MSESIFGVTENDGNVIINGVSDFLISQTFDCGQCFRFDPTENGRVEGIAFGKRLVMSQPSDDTVIIHNSTLEDYNNIWKHYLSLDEDYSEIRKNLLECSHGDQTLSEAMKIGRGIRILNQEPWETLCSFIISQNNNIPRIKGLIRTLGKKYGEKIASDESGKEFYSFPTAAALADAGTDAIFECKTGFRAKYITDASEKVAEGKIRLSDIFALDTESAVEKLCEIKGVGRKVASCTLLFGFGKKDAFPIDVWVKRILAKYYSDDFTPDRFGRYAGIAQQYLFYYERYINAGK